MTMEHASVHAHTTLKPIHKTVAELAALAGGAAQGELSHAIEGAAGLSEAGPKDVSFLGNAKYARAAASSKAGCLFLPPSAGDLQTACKNRIFVEDPQYAFSLVLGLLEATRPRVVAALSPKASLHYEAKLGPNVNIGDFTVVERRAAIGEGTWVGPQCFIGENAKIGRQCRIHPQVVIRENCVVGDRVIIQPGAVIGGDGFGFSTDKNTGKHRKIPQIGNVVIQDDVEVGANVTIDRATTGSTVVGAGSKIDNLVMLAHNVRVGRDCLIVSQVGVAGSTTIGDRAILAGQAGLVGHIAIGDGAVIMAQTGIMSDVEKGQMMFGYPARPYREAMRLQVLYGKLPEIYEAIKDIKEKLGIKSKDGSPGGA